MAKKVVKKKEGGVVFLSPVCSAADSQENSIPERTLHGLLYDERFHSFQNVWPYKKKSDVCNVHNLAMAGFMFVSFNPLKVRCFVCCKTASDLKRNSDPWLVHSEINPECPLIKLGYPAEPDAYTVNEVLQLMHESVGNKLEEEFREFDLFTRRALEAVANKDPSAIFFEDSVSSSGS